MKGRYAFRTSLAQELSRTRSYLGISQLRLARVLGLKLHRLSDLEKARSTPTALEDRRLRPRLSEMVRRALEEADANEEVDLCECEE